MSTTYRIGSKECDTGVVCSRRLRGCRALLSATLSPTDSLAYAEGYVTDTTPRQPDTTLATPSPTDSLAYAEGYVTDTTPRQPDTTLATPSPTDSLGRFALSLIPRTRSRGRLRRPREARATAPHRTAPHRIVLHHTAPHRTAPHRIACITPHHTALHRIVFAERSSPRAVVRRVSSGPDYREPTRDPTTAAVSGRHETCSATSVEEIIPT